MLVSFSANAGSPASAGAGRGRVRCLLRGDGSVEVLLGDHVDAHRLPRGLSRHVVLLEKIEVIRAELQRLEREPGLVVPVLLGLEGNPVGLPVGKPQEEEPDAVEADLEDIALPRVDFAKPVRRNSAGRPTAPPVAEPAAEFAAEPARPRGQPGTTPAVSWARPPSLPGPAPRRREPARRAPSLQVWQSRASASPREATARQAPPARRRPSPGDGPGATRMTAGDAPGSVRTGGSGDGRTAGTQCSRTALRIEHLDGERPRAGSRGARGKKHDGARGEESHGFDTHRFPSQKNRRRSTHASIHPRERPGKAAACSGRSWIVTISAAMSRGDTQYFAASSALHRVRRGRNGV